MPPASPTGRFLDWDACLNVRDLGGLPAARGRIRPRALVRADNLCRLTPAGRAALVGYGVSAVLDLRNPSELAAAPHPFAGPPVPGHPLYLPLPFENEGDLETHALMRAAPTTEAIYVVMLDQFQPNVARILRAILAAPAGPVLFHCYAGKDRTGLIAALLLSAAGTPPEVIVLDYAASDAPLQPLYGDVLAAEATAGAGADRLERLARLLPATPEKMRAALRHLDERYGGALGYLAAIGLSDAEVAQLRARLVDTG